MPSRFWAALLLLVAAGGCSGSNVNVQIPDEGDGGIEVISRDYPPLEGTIGKGGLEGITPLPGPITPISAMETPVPTSTPKPR